MVNLGQAWAEDFMKNEPQGVGRRHRRRLGHGHRRPAFQHLRHRRAVPRTQARRNRHGQEEGLRTQADHRGPGRPGRGRESGQPGLAADHGPAGRDLLRLGPQLEGSRRQRPAHRGPVARGQLRHPRLFQGARAAPRQQGKPGGIRRQRPDAVQFPGHRRRGGAESRRHRLLRHGLHLRQGEGPGHRQGRRFALCPADD